MKRLYFLLAFAFLLLHSSRAIFPSVHNFHHKTSNSGTQNWDVIQHQNNWMYFANNNGLLEFDGFKWSVYPIRNYTNVRSLLYSREEQRIYAGAFNEFGYYERNPSGILSYHTLFEEIAVTDKNFNEIWNISKNEDAIFFQGDKEIFRYKPTQLKRFNFNTKIDCSAVIYNMFIVSGINDGVLTLNGDAFIPLPHSEILKGKKVCAILPFKEKHILFVTDFHGLFVFDGEKTTPFKMDIDSFLNENQVFCAAIQDSRLAIGTVRNGVVVKNLETGKNIYSNIHSGLQNNTVLSLFFDNQENLWLGLDKGIDYVMINSPIYDLFGNNEYFGSGYTSIIQGNILYMGTNQGLYTTSFPIESSPEALKINLLNHMSGQVWDLTNIDNKIFCGSDHGAYIIEGNQVTQIEGIPGTWKLLELNAHPGHILGSSYKGFFILKKENNRWRFANMIKGFSESGGMFEEDKYGNIWFCHWIKGIYKLSLNEKLDSVTVEMFNTNKGFYTDRNNVLAKINNDVVFSSDGGFFEYDLQANNVKHASAIESLFGIYPHSVRLSQMPNGNIWNVSPGALNIAFKKQDGTYEVNHHSFSSLRKKLIMGFEDFNYVNDSTVIVSTENGFSWIDISKARNIVSNPFFVAIRTVFLTNERDSIVGGYQKEQQYIPEFEYKNNSVRFEFVAAEYNDENAVSYSYMLENYDSEWSVYSPSDVKEYTRLPKGTYLFKVRAKNAMQEDIAETSYQFIILPPWYESNVALVIYGLAAIALLFLLAQFVKRRSEKGARDMEIKKEKEMKEQEESFKIKEKEKEKEIIALKNQKLQYELRHKSQELSGSTMNLIRKNEILLDLNTNIEKISDKLKNSDESIEIKKLLIKMQHDIKMNIERDDNWKKFAENFDLVYENYLKRLSEKYPVLTISDKKLCAYLKMGLSSKDIAPLLNMSFRSVEMSRYRLRKKLELERDDNLTDFLQNF